MSDTDLVRQDKNLSHNPLFFASNKALEKNSKGLWVFRTEDGFEINTALEPPTRFDYQILLGLMKQSEGDDWNKEVKTTRNALLKTCGFPRSKARYERLEYSLQKWLHSTCKWDGCFYDGKEYSIMRFNILQAWKLNKETRKLSITFTDEFIARIAQSKYYHYIDIKKIGRLKSHLAIRLFEIIKSFLPRKNRWSIDCIKLVKKIPMEVKYISQAIPKIKAAIKKINKETSISLRMEVVKGGNNKALLRFFFSEKDTNKALENKPGNKRLKVNKAKATRTEIIGPQPVKNEPTAGSIEKERQSVYKLYDFIVFVRFTLKKDGYIKYQQSILEKIRAGHFNNGEGGYSKKIFLYVYATQQKYWNKAEQSRT